MKTCGYCDSEVKERTDRVVRFCSIDCANKSRRIIFPKPCLECRVKFQPPRCHSKQKYCSLECRDTARRQLIGIACKICGTLVKRKPNRIKRFGKAFCTMACFRIYQKENAKYGSEHPQYNRLETICLFCNKKFYRCPSHIRVNNFCSKVCTDNWMSEMGIRAGENNGHWKGGYEPYYGENWHQQRRNARHRDRYKCQNCPVTEKEIGKQLDVHHKIPFRVFGIKNYIEANTLSNLICYCASCHQIIEHLTAPSFQANS